MERRGAAALPITKQGDATVCLPPFNQPIPFTNYGYATGHVMKCLPRVILSFRQYVLFELIRFTILLAPCLFLFFMVLFRPKLSLDYKRLTLISDFLLVFNCMSLFYRMHALGVLLEILYVFLNSIQCLGPPDDASS